MHQQQCAPASACVLSVRRTSYRYVAAARRDPKEIWTEEELVDVVDDDFDDGRELPRWVACLVPLGMLAFFAIVKTLEGRPKHVA